MKCLSLKQPYAELIVSGKKTIELRNWNTSFRGEFLVHASGNPDYEAFELFKIRPDSLSARAAVGKATIYDVKKYGSREELMEDKEKHLATNYRGNSIYGFLLKDTERFDKPIPMRGKLGFFDVELTTP